MAKSLRSKWKRKMRAVKRVRYGQKELEKLKMIISTAKENESTKNSTDVDMTNLSDIATVVTKASIRPEESMETNQNSSISLSNNKFPVWLGSSRRKKLIKRNRQISKIKKKEAKKALKKRK